VKALAALYSRLVGVQIDPWTEVLVPGGAYGALFYTIMSNIGKGDEVKYCNLFQREFFCF